NGDAVATNARTGIEGLETEWFRFRSINDFPDIDTQLMTEFRHLVNQPDIDMAIGIFKKLCCLSFLRALDLHHCFDELAVKLYSLISRSFRNATYNFGGILKPPGLVARINTLRRKCQVKVFIETPSAGF